MPLLSWVDDDLMNDNPDESDDDGDAAELKANRRIERETARKAAVAKAERQPTGKVVGIVKRGWRSYVCHIDKGSLSPNALSSTAPQPVFALPLDRKIPKIRFRTRQVSNLVGQKFLVAIDSWQTTSRHPEGHLIRVLGKVESKEAEIESLLLEHDVPYRPFSKAILDCLPEEGDQWIVPPKNTTSRAWRGREDLRDLLICSIDPPGESLCISSLWTSSDTISLQAAKTSTTPYTHGRCQMATSKRAFVSIS